MDLLVFDLRLEQFLNGYFITAEADAEIFIEGTQWDSLYIFEQLSL